MTALGINISDSDPIVGWESLTYSQRHIQPELREAEAEECAAWKELDKIADAIADGEPIAKWQLDEARSKAIACQARTLQLRHQFSCRHIHVHEEGTYFFSADGGYDTIQVLCDDCGAVV